jgi:hypothetical protein
MYGDSREELEQELEDLRQRMWFLVDNPTFGSRGELLRLDRLCQAVRELIAETT